MGNDDKKNSHTAPYPRRILHVVGGMDTGGVETWLMHVLRRIDRERVRFDFLTHTAKPCFYDEEIRKLGCRIIPCLRPSRPWQYARNFLRIMKDNGPYDVVHSHVHHFSGFPLMLAHYAGVPIRIAHCHSDTSLRERQIDFFRGGYLWIAKELIRRYATTGLACSGVAANIFFGKNWQKDFRWQVLYCGIGLEPFASTVDRDEVHRELGIPPTAFVLGHVGRFTEAKNHEYLIDIFAEVVRRVPKAYLLLVGDGPLRQVMTEKVQRMELTDKVILTGMRLDVPRLMMGAMDVFVFPSRWEGLPLVLVEAQAAGLHCVHSDNITEEVNVLPALMHRRSLAESVGMWADNVLELMGEQSDFKRQAMNAIGNSGFDIATCGHRLNNIYGL